MPEADAANIAKVGGDCADRLFFRHVALLSGCASLHSLASRCTVEPLGLLRLDLLIACFLNSNFVSSLLGFSRWSVPYWD